MSHFPIGYEARLAAARVQMDRLSAGFTDGILQAILDAGDTITIATLPGPEGQGYRLSCDVVVAGIRFQLNGSPSRSLRDAALSLLCAVVAIQCCQDDLVDPTDL